MEQKQAIEKLLQQKQFRLIVLDACRFDAFSEEVDIPGLLEMAHSSGSCTKDWAIGTFSGRYADVQFISSVPYISSMDIGGWRATDHFQAVLPAWKFAWGQHEGVETVLPWKVVEKAQFVNAPRMIIHFMQPHFPYIGEDKLDVPNLLALARKDVLAGGSGWVHYNKSEIYPASEQLRKAYFANLRLVLREIRPVLRSGAVITADHGELLGEGGCVSHPCGSQNPILRNVPWFQVA